MFIYYIFTECTALCTSVDIEWQIKVKKNKQGSGIQEDLMHNKAQLPLWDYKQPKSFVLLRERQYQASLSALKTIPCGSKTLSK